MGEIEFVNDLCCNYLTIPYRGEEGDFALRMMTENVTDVFLAVELRRLDGQIFLYYKISGMQNMEILYTEKQIDRNMFRIFMQQLHEAMEQSRELFLAGYGICLEPSSLFWDLGEERWKFIYIPGRDERESEEIQSEREKLAEFLVMHMDCEDRELTGIIYRFYEEVCEGKILPDFWGKKVISEKMREVPQEEKEKTPELEAALAEGQDFEDSEENREEGELKERSTRSGKKMPVTLCAFLCAAAVATLAAGRVMPDMIIAGTGITVLLAGLLLVALMRRQNKNEKEENKPEDIIYEESENIYGIEEEERGGYLPEEKTVYMDLQREQERKLYGVGKFRRQKIFLDALPCLIGKDKTLVNHIITDASVSRIHAKFFAEQEMIWMQDLNSTNGTYHNGMRLRPNERVKLEPEDEIGFGQAQFIFR